MKFSELIILLPCHSLEDFPLHFEGDDAHGLLTNWTALWHPALIASAGKMPGWFRVDDPPEDLSERLLLAPSVSMGELPSGFAKRAEVEGGLLIREGQDRQAIIDEALAALDERPRNLDDELVADFLALGYCYLQVELLTRQMRYASNLDEVYFNNQLVAAAQAMVSGDVDKTREQLARCFDVLGEERDHFYPVDAFILDLTLVADTTIGQSLRDELQGEPVSLLVASRVIEKMAADEPETLATLRQALAANQVTLVGGEYEEGPAGLYSHEALTAELHRGLSVYQHHTGTRPTVFGRRRFGLSPLWPGVLKGLGFTAALHSTFDGGQFPDGAHIKTMWEGLDGATISCLARPPLDATKPETFLNFCMRMGESMDSDQVATVYFAHWPGQASPWYEDLKRCTRWGPALGKFVTLAEYFASTADDGMQDQFDADQYRSPYLKQGIIRNEEDLLSSFADHERNQVKTLASNSLQTLADLLVNEPSDRSTDTDEGELDKAACRFAEALPRGDATPETGVLVANPHSFVRRVLVEANELTHLPKVEKPIYAADESGSTKRVIVDVPPMGFVWVTGDAEAKADQKPLIEDGVMRNEYFEVRFDETTGALRSLHDYQNRTNRLSQRLAVRVPPQAGGGDGASYSVMVAEELATKTNDATCGEIVSQGRLVDKTGKYLATFEQTYRMTRGSRVLQIDIEVEPVEPLRADPWNSYIACRFAWADESANVHRSVGGVRRHTASRRIESPLYVDLDMAKQQMAILTGGLPFHRLIGYKMLDTLLAVRGQSRQRFTVGVAVDSPYPLQDALSLVTPRTAVTQQASPPAGPRSGWLFHIDTKNVVSTHWSPLVDSGKIVGFKTRLLEPYGRPAKATLSCFKPVKSASFTSLAGDNVEDLEVDGDKVKIYIPPNEWVQVEARW